MYKFKRAFEITMGHEGGYVHDPDDAGGETYRGIARRFHPTWPGWSIIDLEKFDQDFPDSLDRDAKLQDQVRSFYKATFWDRFWGDQLAEIAPSLAYELFDTAVNMGVHRAVIFLQEALNSLNRNQLLFPDLLADGVFGIKSIEALKIYARSDTPELLLKVLNVLQGAHYLAYMGKDPNQEKYARGWFSRVKI